MRELKGVVPRNASRNVTPGPQLNYKKKLGGWEINFHSILLRNQQVVKVAKVGMVERGHSNAF